MINKLKSRKLWVAVIGSALVTLADQLGISPDVVKQVVTLASVYILGQGAVDAVSAIKK